VDTESRTVRLSPPEEIARSKEGFAQLSFAPDGRRLCYVKGEAICACELETGGETALAQGLCPSWRNAGEILFEHEDALSLARLGEGEPQRLDLRVPDAPRSALRAPVAARGGKLAACHVCNVTVPGQAIRRHFFGIADIESLTVTRTRQETYGGTMAWAPGGDVLACAAFEAAGGRLYLMNVSGEVVATLTGLLPSFSPDGSRLAFNEFGHIRTAKRSRDSWELQEPQSERAAETTIVRSNPPMWLGDHLILFEAEGNLCTFDTAKGLTSKVIQLERLARRGVPTLALSPDRRRLVAELDQEGAFRLVSFEIDV